MRHARALLATGAVVAGLLILVTLAAPEVLRRLALARLDAMFAVPVGIEDVDANLVTGRIRATGVVVGAEGGPPILVVPTLDLDVSYRRLLRGATVLQSVTVHAPTLHVERAPGGEFNVLQAFTPTQGGGGGFAIEWLRIEGGAVRFVDRTESPPFERVSRSVELTARDVSTLPGRVDPASFEAGLRIGDGTVTVSGSARPFERPAGVELLAQLRQIDPSLIEPYLPVRVDVAGSRLDADIRYVRSPRADGSGTHVLEASAALGPARLVPEEGRTPVVAVDGLRVGGFRFDLVANRAAIAELVVRAPRVRLLREADGALEIARVLGGGPARGTDAAEPARARGAAPFALTVEQARIENGRLELSDRTIAPPAGAVLHGVDARVTGLGLGGPPGAARVRATGRIGAAGSLSVDGTWQPVPTSTTLGVEIAGLPIETFEPYANAALGIRTVRRGTVGGQLEVRFARPPDGAAARLAVSGRVVGRDLAFGIPDIEDPLLTTVRLVADLERVTLLPELAADVDRIQLVAPALRLRRDEQSRLNVQRLWQAVSRAQAARPPRAPAPAPGDPREDGPAPPLRIRRIQLTDGRVAYRDAAVDPAFVERAAQLSVLVRDVGGGGRSPVRLSARVGEGAPLELQGWIVPFGGPLRLSLAGGLEGYELPRLHPLPERWVGYHVRRGRVTVEVAYEYDGDRLTGLNTVTVRQFELGDRVSDRFRELVGIPLPAALRLLPRRDGALRLEIPVSGELSHPKVRFGPVIADAVRSTLVRTITAPFRLLGSVLVQAGRIDDLRVAPLPFEPGTVTPVPDAVTRLTALVELLADRERLGVEIVGRTGSADVPAIKRERLERELAATGRNPTDGLASLYAAAGGAGSFGPVPADVMRERVLERMAVSDEELGTLALARAKFVEQLLLSRGVRRDQLFVVEPDQDRLRTGAPRVELAILY